MVIPHNLEIYLQCNGLGEGRILIESGGWSVGGRGWGNVIKCLKNGWDKENGLGKQKI